LDVDSRSSRLSKAPERPDHLIDHRGKPIIAIAKKISYQLRSFLGEASSIFFSHRIDRP
jgi:hypothetical protein